MVANRAASLEQPVFMLASGAKFAIRLRLAAGSRRGWVPLMFQGAPKLRVGFSKSDQGDSLPVVGMESNVSRWSGVAVWDSDSQRTRDMAGKFGQQTRLVVTSDWKCKVRPLPCWWQKFKRRLSWCSGESLAEPWHQATE